MLAVSGCRDFYPGQRLLKEVLYYVPDGVHVGDASGVDQAVREYCRQQDISCTVFAASRDFTDPDHPVVYASDWREHGKAAGPMRNSALVKGCDAFVAVWDGRSPGTLSAIRCAMKENIRVTIYSTRWREQWR